jgi:pimeloyl-ACP methyl ester carboxylesterase
MTRVFTAALAALSLVSIDAAYAESTPTKSVSSIDLQETFDHIGAEVHALSKDDRTSYYIDEGPKDGQAVLFIGGQGTSLEAFQLTEFARTSREALGLRVISVERNGFGESEFNAELGYADYTREVIAVLDHLGVDKFVIMAISGGGAYAAQVAAATPDRVLSLHLGAAVSRTLPTRTAPNCSETIEEVNQRNTKYTHNPKDWWGVPGSPVLVIPGWQTRAYADATRSFYVGGQVGNPAALTHERLLPCNPDAVVDASKITAPAYLYYGETDKAVTVEEMKQWGAALPNVAKATVYPGEGHTVQYRHWDQILVDMAGYADYTVVCRDQESQLVKNDRVAADDFIGICAWKTSPEAK